MRAPLTEAQEFCHPERGGDAAESKDLALSFVILSERSESKDLALSFVILSGAGEARAVEGSRR